MFAGKGGLPRVRCRAAEPTRDRTSSGRLREVTMALSIRKLSAGIGAEISGVDLAERIENATFSEIEKAWQEHLILLFRGQKLTHAQHIAFSRRFGELDDHAAIPKFRDP